MYKKIILKDVREVNDKVILSGAEGAYAISKKDLRGIQLTEGDEVGIVEFPGYPGIAASLDFDGYRIFSKRREDVTDEYLKGLENKMYAKLTPIGVSRIKMFEKFVEEYTPADRLHEIMALTLGFELYRHIDDEEDIDTFADLSVEDQSMLPELHHHTLPQIPVDTVVVYAKAFLHDDEADIVGLRNEELLVSELMHLPNSNWESCGNFCEPRDEYIRKYIATL